MRTDAEDVQARLPGNLRINRDVVRSLASKSKPDTMRRERQAGVTTTGDLRIDDWVVHRPNVVRSVAARVPGIDAEEATSRALEKMVRLATTGAAIEDPAPYWRRAAVNEAISMTREAGRATPVQDDTLDGLAPPAPGAELTTERQADATMLRTALADLTDDDRKILLDRHVHDMAVTDIAGHLGVRPHAVTMRLRRAEERLAGAFAAAHAHTVNEPECRTTRAAMHDYLKGRLLPRRQRRLEIHMDTCGQCTRAFIDVREVSWMLRDLGQHLIAATITTGTAGLTTAGLATGTPTGTPTGTAKPRTPGKKETAIAAGVLAALALGGSAAAYIANQPDQPSVQAIDNTGSDTGSDGGADGAGGGGTGGAGWGAGGAGSSPATENQPPSIAPQDPRPRPATTPKADRAGASNPVEAPHGDLPSATGPAPVVETEPERAPGAPATDSRPAPIPDQAPPGANKPAPPEPAEPPAEGPGPAPEGPVAPPVEPPEVPEPPVVVPQRPGVGTTLESLLATFGLVDLPGVDLATMTLNEVWELLFSTFTDTAGQAVDNARSATGG